MTTTWADVSEGMEIPTLEKDCTSQQLVMWAAASGDFYQIHYDEGFAKDTGLDGIIVHGALKHAFLGQLLYDWVAPSGKVVKFGCSYRGMDPLGKLLCKGKVTRKYEEDGRKLLDLDVWVENPEGKTSTPGTATVELAA